MLIRNTALLVVSLILAACSAEGSSSSGAADTGAHDAQGQRDAAIPETDADDRSDATTDAGSDDACVHVTCEALGAVCGEHADGCGASLMCGTCEESAATCTPDGQCVTPSAEMRSSVEQYGITWTFDREYPTGQFVTGDWWVVGPVTVVSVSPAPDGTRNGSMLNPVGAQAYDSRAGSYDETKGVSFPLAIEPNASLVSSISHPEEGECEQGGRTGWRTYDGGCQRGPIATQAVMTVVDAPVLEGTFRPSYASVDKRFYHVDSVDWTRLPASSPPQSAPDAASLLRALERPWIDHLGSWTMQHGCATLNMYCYGREIGNRISTAAAFVLLDTPEQHELARRLIQLGIDNHGVLRAGGGWGADGGHFNGRKFPIVFAGALLGEADMASPGTEVGNEDQMTYYGADGTALWGRDCNSCYLENGCGYGGDCTNGSKDCRDPDAMIDGCADYRNCCTSRTWVGEALAARSLNLMQAWGHDAFFDYVDRWMAGGVDGGGSSASDFIDEMWSLHR